MTVWDTATAEWYAHRYGEYATNRLAVAALALEPEAVLVDVGCSTGAALRAAAGRITGGRLIGVDPVPRMLEIARERAADHEAAGRIEFRLGQAEDLPIDSATVDVALAFDSFDHWSDQEAGLAEIRRILQPGGRLAVVKDGGLPGGGEAGRRFEQAASAAGFTFDEGRRIAADGVTFTLWLCLLRAADHPFD